MIDEVALRETHSENAATTSPPPVVLTGPGGLPVGIGVVTIDNWQQYRDAGWQRRLTRRPEDIEYHYQVCVDKFGAANVATGQVALLIHGWPVETAPSPWWKPDQIDKFKSAPYQSVYVWEPPAQKPERKPTLMMQQRAKCANRRARLRARIRSLFAKGTSHG